MKFLIHPRQYGKTYQLKQWWLEDPEHRMIIVYDTSLAILHRHDLEWALQDAGYEIAAARRLLKKQIRSWRSFRNNPGTDALRNRVEVAIDDAGPILDALFKGKVTWVAGTGLNRPADAEQAERAHVSHLRWAVGLLDAKTLEEECGILFQDEE